MTRRIERIPYEGCPLCGGGEMAKERSVNCSLHPMYHPDLSPIMDWLRCAECAHLFVHDKPTTANAGTGKVREIPIAAITGTLEPGRAREFDAEFRPRSAEYKNAGYRPQP